MKTLRKHKRLITALSFFVAIFILINAPASLYSACTGPENSFDPGGGGGPVGGDGPPGDHDGGTPGGGGGGSGGGGGGETTPGGGPTDGGGGGPGTGGGDGTTPGGDDTEPSQPSPGELAAGELNAAANSGAQAENEHGNALADAAAQAEAGKNSTSNQGNEINNNTQIGDPVLVSTGRFIMEIEDYAIPGSNFSIRRTYLSQEPTIGSLGASWLVSIDSRIMRGVTRINQARLDNISSLLASILGNYNRIDKSDAEAAAIARRLKEEVYLPTKALLAELQDINAKGERLAALNRHSRFLGTPEFFEAVGNESLVIINEDGVPIVFEPAGTGVWLPKHNPDRLHKRLESVDGGGAESVSGFVLFLRGGRTKHYDGYGMLVGVTELNENRVDLRRDGIGRVTRILGPHRNEWEVTHTGNFISVITGPEGTDVRFGYSGNELAWAQDRYGNRGSFVYEEGRLTQIVNPDGSMIILTYGLEGPNGIWLVTSTTHEEGASEYFEYFPNQRMTFYTNYSGVWGRYWYDAMHRVIREEHSDGTIKTFQFNNLNQLERKSINGFETRFRYDSRGNVIEKAFGDGSRETWEWSVTDQVTRHVDRDGVVTEWRYDSRWNCVEIRRGGVVIFTASFDDRNRLISSRLGEQEEFRFEYDERDFVSYRVVNINRQQIRERWVHDGFGRIIKYVDGAGRVWEYSFSASGVTERTPLGLERRFEYNNRNQRVRIIERDTRTGEVRERRFVYDRRHARVEEIDGAGNITRFTHRADGELIRKEQGPWFWEFTHDAGGRINTVTRGKLGSNARFTERFDYTRHGWYTERTISRPGSGTNTFRINPWGQVTSVTNALGERSVRTLNAAGNPLREQAASGGFFEFRYDALGRLFQAGREGERFVQVRYNRDGSIAERTDRLGNVTRYVYDGRGLLTRIISALGEERFFYDEAGRIIRHELASRNSVTYLTEWLYDDNLRTVTIIRGGFYTETLHFNAWGEVVRQVDGVGNERSFEFDGAGRLVRIIDGYGRGTSYAWNEIGRLSSITFVDGKMIHYEYDHLGNLVEVRDVMGVSWSGEYDEAGRLIREITRPGIDREFRYDLLGRIIEVRRGGEVVERYTYTNRGREVVFIDGAGGRYTQRRNAFGEMVEEINRMGDTQRFVFNVEGQLIGQTAFSDRQTRVEYRPAEGLTITTFYDGTQTILERDLLGNIVRVTNETGTIRFRYDAGGRLVEQIDEGAGEVTRFFYDRAGRRIRMLSGNRDVHYQYGRNGQLLRVFDNSQRLEVRFEYDKRGREIRRIFGNGVRQETFYDAIGRVILIRELDSLNRLLRAEGYLYDERGRRTHSVDEEGRVRKYLYDNQSRLSAVLYPWTREKAEADRREAEEAGLFFTPDRGVGERYSFSASELIALREILNMAGPMGGNVISNSQMMWRHSFTYDPNGNRASKTTPWGTIYYEYDAENRLVRKGDIVFTNDRDGNMLSARGLRYEARFLYNAQNRMIFSQIINHVTNTHVVAFYAYDGFGRRTLTENATGQMLRTLYAGISFEVIREGETFRDGSLTTSFVPSGPHIGTESNQQTGERYRWVTDGSSSQARTGRPEDGFMNQGGRFGGRSVTLFARGEAVARSYSSSVGSRSVYLGKDIMGSVRTVTGSAGAVESRFEYCVFGQPFVGDLSGWMNLGYMSKPFDVITGLYNYGFRDYRPQLARFTTVDPIRDGNNWFLYVKNDPINNWDLWGLKLIARDTENFGPPSPHQDTQRDWGGSVAISVNVFAGAGYKVTAGAGIVIAVSSQSGISVGTFTTAGMGAQQGYSVGANVTVSFSTETQVTPGTTTTVTGGGSYNPIPGLGPGGGVSVSHNLDTGSTSLNFSGNIGIGSKGEAHQIISTTTVRSSPSNTSRDQIHWGD